jgi:heme/copper-type cytochrome/quinol oxidase subunit 3
MADAPLTLAAAPAPPTPRPRVLFIGSMAASAAAAMGLVGLMGIYLARRADVVNAGERWIPDGANFQIAQPTMILFTLLPSVVTVLWLVDALKRDDRAHAWLAAGLTLMFGLATINMSTYLLSVIELPVRTEPGLLVLAISGYHLVMVVLGMAFLGVVFLRSLFGQYRRIPDGAAAAAVWWSTTAALWPLIWLAIHITK